MWSVCIARFDYSGNAKALQSGASDEASAPRSFYVCPESKTMNNCQRSLGRIRNSL